MSQTPAQLILRNRANARLSTGPRTAEGKCLSRRNALRHGLTANPAAGVAEDPAAFRRLLRVVIERIQPRDVIEESLVHRIAVCLWRQQRAVRAETALAGCADAAVVPMRAEVQSWMASILDAWKPELREIQAEVEEPTATPGRTRRRRRMRHIYVRPALQNLDRRRETEVMSSGAGITAMIEVLVDLTDRLERTPSRFDRDQCEQLGWLLGESASRYPTTDDAPCPDQYQLPTKVQALIGLARLRKQGEPVPEELVRLIRHQIRTLQRQRRVCEVPYDQGHWDRQKAAALLLDGPTMDRLLRYEAHADRTLVRALETLARLRGVRVEGLSASLTMHAAQGIGTLRVEGPTARIWSPGLVVMG